MVTKSKAKSKPKPKPKKENKRMWTSKPKEPAPPLEYTPAPEAVIPTPVEEEAPKMADNNYDPKEVGGLQPIYCPYCNKEVMAQDSYHLSLDNKRYHYPICWQRHELGDKG